MSKGELPQDATRKETPTMIIMAVRLCQFVPLTNLGLYFNAAYTSGDGQQIRTLDTKEHIRPQWQILNDASPPSDEGIAVIR